MRKKHIEEIYQELSDRKQEILNELKKNHSEYFQNMNGDVADLADEAEEAIERDLIYHLSLNEKQELEEINLAIKKIEDGHYGSCVSCGADIPIERLKIKPSARYCTKCQEKYERDRRHSVPVEDAEESTETSEHSEEENEE